MISAKLDMSGFEARRDALAKAPLLAARDAVNEGGAELKYRLRLDAQRALGDRMFHVWTHEVYPRGNRLANNPAAVVYSRAPEIIDAFEFGRTIQGGRSGALYIPIPGTPADKRRKPGQSLVKEMIARFGRPLELPQKDGSGWLLLFKTRTSRRSGKLTSSFYSDRKTGERKQATAGVTWTPFFVVEPQVSLPRKLNARTIMDSFSREWPGFFAAHLARVMARS